MIRILFYTIQAMNTIKTTEVFRDWFAGLRDKQAQSRIEARIRRAGLGNFGDVKPVGGGVSEMRIHYGPGYRVYFAQQDRQIVILLAGGNKSSQAQDISLAQELAQTLKEQDDGQTEIA
jgi:putative addiction module killer protein